MALRTFFSLILALHLAWGIDESYNFTENTLNPLDESKTIFTLPEQQNPTVTTKEETQQPKTGRCWVWWCDETLEIPIAAGLGAIFLISLILFITSCCLWRKRSNPVVTMMELEALAQNATAECTVNFSAELGNPEPVTANDNGICDVESCTSEAPQDMANNLPSPEYKLPEVPDLPPPAE